MRHVESFQINRAIKPRENIRAFTTETLSHGVFNGFSPCLRVSVVQNRFQGLLGLIVNLQNVAILLI
jgi:hypothetical protein